MRKTDLKTQKNEWEKVRCTSFSRWLFSYVGKNPQVHDLASDAKRDSAWPRRARNFWEFHQHLENGGGAWLTSVLSDAWYEYSGGKFYRQYDFPIAALLDEDDIQPENMTVLTYGDKHQRAPSGYTYLYALFENGEYGERLISYVGKSKQPARRIKQHVLRPANRKMYKWIMELESRKQSLQMVVFDCVEDSQVNKAEKAAIYWIGRAAFDCGRKFMQYTSLESLGTWMMTLKRLKSICKKAMRQ